MRVGATIHVSGMTGTDPATGRLAGASIQAQTQQALRNGLAVVEAAVARWTTSSGIAVLLTDPADFGGMNDCADVFPADPPTRAVAKLGVLLPDVLVSILMTAQVEE